MRETDTDCPLCGSFQRRPFWQGPSWSDSSRQGPSRGDSPQQGLDWRGASQDGSDQVAPNQGGPAFPGPQHSRLKDYWQCDFCSLIFLEPSQRLTVAEEKERYHLHQNVVTDEAYLKFLSRLWVPLRDRLQDHQLKGLDFGCGPAQAFRELALRAHSGFRISPYDPQFFPDSSVLQDGYDFIILSEVAEHLCHPGQVFGQLIQYLQPGGWLALMTGELEDWTQFPRWHYPRDPTHICFYPQPARKYVADRWGLQMRSPALSVTLYQRL